MNRSSLHSPADAELHSNLLEGASFGISEAQDAYMRVPGWRLLLGVGTLSISSFMAGCEKSEEASAPPVSPIKEVAIDTPPPPPPIEIVVETAEVEPEPPSLISRGWGRIRTTTVEGFNALGDTSYQLAATTRNAVERTLEEAGDAGTFSLAQAEKVLAYTGELMDYGVENIGRDPTLDRTRAEKLGLLALKTVPGVGATVRYADAKKLYACALQMQPESAERFADEQQAKRECLRACVELGLDISTLGTSGLLGQSLDYIDKTISLLNLVEKIDSLTPGELNVLNRALELALRDPRVDTAMHQLLVMDFSEALDFRTPAVEAPASDSEME